jgi:serine/threonine-protein kinase RsbW
MQDRLIIELQGNLSEIPRLARQIEAFGCRNNLPKTALHHINLAVDELLTNTISYGFDGPGSRVIRVSLQLDDGLLSVELLDSAKPFDPFAQPDPDITQSIENRPIGGLGIFFARKLMDHVGYHHANGQNRVTLGKKIDPPGT